MRFKLILATLVMFCAVQDGAAQGFQFGINFLVSQPKNEFQENVEDLGLGIGGMFAYRPGNSPILIGADLGFAIYGSESRREPFSTTIPDVTVEVETSNNIFLLHALVRLQGNSGTFRPYMDGLIGMHYFFTETKVKDDDDFSGEPIASSVNQHDAAFSYGVAGGLMLRVYQKKQQEKQKTVQLKDVMIDFRTRFSFGGEATYLKKGSITRENGAISIDALRSRTDLLTYQIGVIFAF